MSSRVRFGGRRRACAGAAVAVLLVAPMAACDVGPKPDPNPSPTADAGPEDTLTFGAYGTQDELAAYSAVVDRHNSLSDGVDVELESSPDESALADALRKGDVPDVFLVSRDELAWLLEEDLTQPVDAMLDARGLDFGDGYSRDGLQAFSAEDRLQCMPYGISPMVIFYNTEMVDFDKMQRRGLPVPQLALDPESVTQSWSFDAFAAAAQFAARPRTGTRGVYVEPTLDALAPFIYSNGGQVYDDEDEPTSLAFSDDDTRSALELSLELLRSPLVTPTERQLAKNTALEMFEKGQLGMVEGYRSLVPELRQVQGLEFDVIAMPAAETPGTVGQLSGLCLSADTADPASAADFMVNFLSGPSVQRVVRAGYLVPANLEVALSDDFLQPGRLPRHSGVFNSSVRAIQFRPLLTTLGDLQRTIAPSLERLLNEPVLDDLDALTEQIDEESRTVLDPEAATPSESPSE